MSQENEVWNWHADTNGRIHSVSSGFTSTFGTSAAKEIIGNHFWTFAERLDKPSNGWLELDNAFKNSEKISKFIFHYQSHTQDKIKIAISGEPVFDKNKYIGYSGIGYIADKNEISIPEISQNMLGLSIDNLNLGIAIFSPEVGLIEFNQSFVEHLENAKVKIIRNMRYDAVLSNLKAHNKYYPEISNDIDSKDFKNICCYFETHDKNFIFIKKTNLDNGFIIVKSEIDKTMLHGIKSYTASISELKQKNNMLENRIQDYKNKLSDFFNKQENKTDYFQKMLRFFENNIDIGILITNNDGTIDNANYAIAQLFGFTTVSMLIKNTEIGSDFQEYLTARQERIKDLTDNNINRFEHILSLNNYIYQGKAKEIIVFYPSVHKPNKIISFFYPEMLNQGINAINDSSTPKDTENNILNTHQNFIQYIANDIKNSINVIHGYNDLQSIHQNPQEINLFQEKIQQSCTHILRSISDVMQVYKISSDMFKLEQSVFYCSDILKEALGHFNDYIHDNNINLNLELKTNGLLIISDKELFYDAVYKILDMLIHSSDKGAKVKIKIIEDIHLEKIDIIIIDEAKINIQNILETDIHHIFNDSKSRYTASLNLKIAQSYLTLLKCRIVAVHQEDRGNVVTINLSGDMITTHDERDSNNLVI